jgi:hypothetical protein
MAVSLTGNLHNTSVQGSSQRGCSEQTAADSTVQFDLPQSRGVTEHHLRPRLITAWLRKA